MFRFFIGDEVAEYTMPDFISLSMIDQAIDKLSSLAGRKYTWSGTVTSGDVTNGYITLSPHPSYLDLPDYWNLRGNRVFLNNTMTVGTTYSIRGKVGFNKYGSSVVSDVVLDLPSEAYLAVVYYALGLYSQLNSIGSVREGQIKSKKEDGLEVEYGMDTTMTDFTPKALMDKGLKLMQDLPFAQDMFFSVRL